MMKFLPIALALSLPVLGQEAWPDAVVLTEQALALFPVFEGDHKAFLTKTEAQGLRAASHLLAAANELQPDLVYAYWWRGHAASLLAEDRTNRGQPALGQEYFQEALEAFESAIRLDGGHYWSHYARGMAHTNLGSPTRAIENYARAIELADAVIDSGGDEATVLDARLVRFKSRRWKTDARLRLFQFEAAREEFRSFYADNGNNQWNLAYSLGETYLRERDFLGAQETYLGLLEIPEYQGFEQTYSQLGYLAGVLGDPEEAQRWLERSLEHEFSPSFYPRLWMFILAPEDRRAATREELADFVSHPPADARPWDLTLGRYLLGELDLQGFREAAQGEVARRMAEAEALDDLSCEVEFYVGAREEWNAQASSGAAADAHLDRARQAFRKALGFTTGAFKWEWEFARTALSRVSGGGVLGEQDWSLDGGRLSSGPEPGWLGAGALEGKVESLRWHAPGARTATAGPPPRESLVAGVLMQFLLLVPGEDPRPVQVVLDLP